MVFGEPVGHRRELGGADSCLQRELREAEMSARQLKWSFPNDRKDAPHILFIAEIVE
jgi:hypothetical protein